MLRIKDLLKEKGMPVHELAKMIDLTPQNLSKLINERSKPSIETFERIAKALNVQLIELFVSETKTELTALVEHRNEFYKAETLEGLKGIVHKIESKMP
ncbi:MAG: helix-turn-helix domain-containing protein [Mangrovibacterium sp.]